MRVGNWDRLFFFFGLKQDRVSSIKHFNLKSVLQHYNKDLKKKENSLKIWPTDPTLFRACEGKQTIIFFGLTLFAQNLHMYASLENISNYFHC